MCLGIRRTRHRNRGLGRPAESQGVQPSDMTRRGVTGRWLVLGSCCASGRCPMGVTRYGPATASTSSLNLMVLYGRDVDACCSFCESLRMPCSVEQHGTGPEHRSSMLDDGTVMELYPANAAGPTGTPSQGSAHARREVTLRPNPKRPQRAIDDCPTSRVPAGASRSVQRLRQRLISGAGAEILDTTGRERLEAGVTSNRAGPSPIR